VWTKHVFTHVNWLPSWYTQSMLLLRLFRTCMHIFKVDWVNIYCNLGDSFVLVYTVKMSRLLLNTSVSLSVKYDVWSMFLVHQSYVVHYRLPDSLVLSARCNIYVSRLCYDVSVRLSVTEVHWCIIANLGYKFRSIFTMHCGRGACGCEGRDHRREEWRDHLALC